MSDLVQPLEQLDLVDQHKVLHPVFEEFNCNKKAMELAEENSESPPESFTVAAESDSLEYYTFSEANLQFDVIISSSHLKPRYNVIIPPKITKELPQDKVPVVLNSYGKSWTMFYNGLLIAKTLDRGWKPFADDNELKIGDACFFELTEKSETGIVFKVVILRTASLPCGGDTEDEPIIIE